MKGLAVVLRANAAFSIVSGGSLLLAAPAIGTVLGSVEPWLLRLIGAGLLLFAALVLHEARAPSAAGTWPILAGDLGWVLASILLVAWGPGWLSLAGRWVVLVVAAIVGLFAYLQWHALARWSTRSQGG